MCVLPLSPVPRQRRDESLRTCKSDATWHWISSASLPSEASAIHAITFLQNMEFVQSHPRRRSEGDAGREGSRVADVGEGAACEASSSGTPPRGREHIVAHDGELAGAPGHHFSSERICGGASQRRKLTADRGEWEAPSQRSGSPSVP